MHPFSLSFIVCRGLAALMDPKHLFSYMYPVHSVAVTVAFSLVDLHQQIIP